MVEDIYTQALQVRSDRAFMDAFNLIEQHLRTKLNKVVEVGFSKLVTQFFTAYPTYEGQADLQAFASLRNAISHSTTNHEEPLVLPSLATLERIEEIRDALLKPQLVFPRFEKKVVCVQIDDTVASVLNKVAANNFSQFPVYDGTNYCGLLTENGITRWMAQHVQIGRIQLNVEQATTRDLMQLEEGQSKCCFIAADTPIPEMLSLFFLEPAMEAALISDTGSQSEPLRGIANVYDVLEMSAFAARRVS